MAKESVLNMENKEDLNNIWIADSAASTSVTNSLSGMSELSPYEGSIQVGNGAAVKVQYKGVFTGKTDIEGHAKTIKIRDVLVAFDFIGNLFSITKALSGGAKLDNDDENIVVRKGDIKLVFGEKIHSGNGFLLGCKLEPISKLGNTSMEKGYSMTENKEKKSLPAITMHMKLGHASETKTRATAKKIGQKLHGKMDVCSSCAEGKAHQKKVAKASEGSKKIGERVYIDLSTVKNNSYGNKHHWVLLVDEFSRFKWSIFLQKKSDLAEKVYDVFKEIENNKGLKFEKIRCDNAGENHKLQEMLKENNYGATFEYTAPGTPQQNGVVERAFATLYGKVRSMLNWAQLPENMRKGLWAECAHTATALDNLLVDEYTNTCAHEKFYGDLPKYVNDLKVFGEVGIIRKIDSKKRPKLEDKGLESIFVGYAEDHSGDVYRMYCPRTKSVRLSRDIKWFNKSYGAHKKELSEGNIKYDYDDNDGAVSSSEEESEEENEVQLTIPTPKTLTRKTRQTELEKLDTFYNPTIGTVSWALMSAVNSDYLEPTTYYQAWNHEDPEEQKNWRGAITKEFDDMERRNVWELVDKKELPPGRQPIGSKWVFKRKKNGVYRARLVALGYNQIPGIDFTDNFSPVTSDTTIKILLVCMIKNGWFSQVIDIETAFLEGRLNEDIYMKIPIGYLEYLKDAHRVTQDMIMKLLGSMYGLVQASRIWYKTLKETLIERCGMKRCELDIGLFYKMTEDGPVILCVYVDDIFMVGAKKGIFEIIAILRKYFMVKLVGMFSMMMHWIVNLIKTKWVLAIG